MGERILNIVFFIANTLIPLAYACVFLNDISLENIFYSIFCIMWIISFYNFIAEMQRLRDELNILKVKHKRNDE